MKTAKKIIETMAMATVLIVFFPLVVLMWACKLATPEQQPERMEVRLPSAALRRKPARSLRPKMSPGLFAKRFTRFDRAF